MGEIIGYSVLGYAVVLLLCSMVVQSMLSPLVDVINRNPQQLGLTRPIPEWYFVLALSRCRYAPAYALYKAKQPPLEIAQACPNYKHLRCWACALWFAHIGLGLVMVVAFMLTRVAL